MRIRWKPELHHLAANVALQVRRHPRLDASVAAGAVVAAVAVYLVARSRRPDAEEQERRRRDRLAVMGRLIDGHLVDVRSFDGEDSMEEAPDVLFYSYRLAGVTYNCAQDVSKLGTQVRGYRLDQPVQVRYDARNPGNSIIAAVGWSGVRSLPGPALHVRLDRMET